MFDSDFVFTTDLSKKPLDSDSVVIDIASGPEYETIPRTKITVGSVSECLKSDLYLFCHHYSHFSLNKFSQTITVNKILRSLRRTDDGRTYFLATI